MINSNSNKLNKMTKKQINVRDDITSILARMLLYALKNVSIAIGYAYTDNILNTKLEMLVKKQIK